MWRMRYIQAKNCLDSPLEGAELLVLYFIESFLPEQGNDGKDQP